MKLGSVLEVADIDTVKNALAAYENGVKNQIKLENIDEIEDVDSPDEVPELYEDYTKILVNDTEVEQFDKEMDEYASTVDEMAKELYELSLGVETKDVANIANAANGFKTNHLNALKAKANFRLQKAKLALQARKLELEERKLTMKTVEPSGEDANYYSLDQILEDK